MLVVVIVGVKCVLRSIVNAHEHEGIASVAQMGIHMPTVVDVHVDRGRCTALWLAKVLDTSH